MRVLKYIKSLSLVLLSATILTTSAVYMDQVSAQTNVKNIQSAQTPVEYQTVSPLTVVNSPSKFINKNIIMNAKFDKFSTLGLDYKVAYRTSEEYISFLIKRDDTTHDIPLSEMKLFLKRDLAEKFIELKTNDEIEIKGNVFSDALGDSWIDVKELRIIKKAEDKNNGDN